MHMLVFFFLLSPLKGMTTALLPIFLTLVKDCLKGEVSQDKH